MKNQNWALLFLIFINLILPPSLPAQVRPAMTPAATPNATPTPFPHPDKDGNILESLDSLQWEELYRKIFFSRESLDFKINPLNLSVDSGWSGNGGDFLMQENNIWFLGDQPVTFCLKRSEQYPFTLEELRELVRESLEDWNQFFKKYGMDKRELEAVSERGNERFLFWDQKPRKMSLTFTEGMNCPWDQNGENVGNNLYFLFETSNNIVSSYRQFSTEHALGVAVRKKFDHQTYRNGGYVWLANFTRDRQRLKHMLLHELGHVFGMVHDSVFVMNENAAVEVELKEHLNSEYFGRIESGSWPYRTRPGEELILTSNRGRIFPRRSTPENPLCQRENFVPNRTLPPAILDWAGLPRQGHHQIKLLVHPSSRPGPDDFQLELSVEDLFTGKITSLKGEFNSLPAGKWELTGGPSLFTRWKREGVPHASPWAPFAWRRAILDSVPPLFPARGRFHHERKKMAARISVDKGPVIEIFIPELNRWWVLRGLQHEKFED